MNDAKSIGLDVHQATISVAVLDSSGKLVMEAILETKAETILAFIHSLRGSLHVTFEEGTCAAWLNAFGATCAIAGSSLTVRPKPRPILMCAIPSTTISINRSNAFPKSSVVTGGFLVKARTSVLFESYYNFHYSTRSTKKSFPVSVGKLFYFQNLLVGAVGIENNTG